MNSRDRYLARASAAYNDQFQNPANADLWGVNAGRGYLADHGIESFDIAKRYQLGVVINPLPGDHVFQDMLVFPYITPAGIKGLKFRRLKNDDDGRGKNLVHDGQPVRLYNTQAYFDAGDVIGIAEGEADAICATERLGIPTVGIPGSENWKKYKGIWASLFKNFQNVYVFTDGDKINKLGVRPGEELGKGIVESLGWRARIIRSPEGEDVSSMVAAGRHAELEAQYLGDTDEDDDDE